MPTFAYGCTAVILICTATTCTSVSSENDTAVRLPATDLIQEGLVDWCFMNTRLAWALNLSVPGSVMSKISREACSISNNSMHAIPEIMSCLNAKYELKSITWQQWVSESVTALKVYASFSYFEGMSQPRSSSVPLTVIVGATVSRLRQLYAQCLSWGGPLSAALVQPLMQPAGPLTFANHEILKLSSRLISRFVSDMKAVPSACQPDVLLVYELYQDEASYKLLYPCNLLRNLARLQARTPLIAMVDVDMLLSNSLFRLLKNQNTSAAIVAQVQQQRKILLLPAFNVRGRHEKAAWADALASDVSNKDLLLHALEQGIVYQFGGDHFSVGHRLVNYTHWTPANRSYTIPYEFMSEPWYIGDRHTLPWYDMRYRGYGLNKVQQVLDTFAKGHTFDVLHDAYLVHRSHTISNASRTYKASFSKPNKTSAGFLLKEFVQGLLRAQVREHVLRTDFQPQVDKSTDHCKSVLPWWKV